MLCTFAPQTQAQCFWETNVVSNYLQFAVGKTGYYVGLQDRFYKFNPDFSFAWGWNISWTTLIQLSPDEQYVYVAAFEPLFAWFSTDGLERVANKELSPYTWDFDSERVLACAYDPFYGGDWVYIMNLTTFEVIERFTFQCVHASIMSNGVTIVSYSPNFFSWTYGIMRFQNYTWDW